MTELHRKRQTAIRVITDLGNRIILSLPGSAYRSAVKQMTPNSSKIILNWQRNRVEGGVTPAAPPYIRFRIRRFLTSICSINRQCLTSYKRPALPRDFRSLLPALGPLSRHLLRTYRKVVWLNMSGSVLHCAVKTATMTSADFWQPIPTPYDAGSTRQVDRSPRVIRATFLPYTRRIYSPTLPDDYWASKILAFSPG